MADTSEKPTRKRVVKPKTQPQPLMTTPDQPTAIEDTPITVHEAQIIPYKWMYGAAMVAAVIYAAIIALQTVARANPDLGLSPQVYAWLEVIENFIGGIGFLLPTLRKPPSDERKGMD